MKNIENGLTRRALLGNGLKTAAGIVLLGGTPNLLGSCAIDDNKHYRFDLSRLNNWQSDLFLKAGRDYWGINEGRDDSSRNKVYFGKVPEGEMAYAYWDWHWDEDWDLNIRERKFKSEKIYTFTIIFKEGLDWVDCDNGLLGKDFYRATGHELGHIVHEKGPEIHSDNPNDIMYNPIPQRCLL